MILSLTAGHDMVRASLTQVLKFCTGPNCVPPMGLAGKITVSFQRRPNLVLPKADACIGIINLPIVHNCRQAFFEKMDFGILCSINHYGRC